MLSQGQQLLIEQLLNLHRQQVRHTVGKSKANRVLVLTQAQWDEAEKVRSDEIRLHGKLFDIKSMHQTKGQVLLYGHFDTKEDGLQATARALDEQNQMLKKSGFFAFFFFEDFPAFLTYRSNFFVKTIPLYAAIDYRTRVVPVEAPPPRRA